MGFFWTIVVLVVALAVAWRYLGAYMVAVYEAGCTSSVPRASHLPGARHEP